MSSVVFLFGNGLSRGFDEAFNTGDLSARVLAKLEPGDKEVVERLAASLTPDSGGAPAGAAGGATGFEAIAGPLDRIADALLVARELNFARGAPDVVSKFQQASSSLRSFYLRIVGVTLSEVTSLCVDDGAPGRAEKWKKMNEFGESLMELSGKMPVWAFTLNYDSLLDSAVLEARKEASVRMGREVYLYDGFRFGRLNAPLDLWEERIALYHLHGSVAWIEREEDVLRPSLEEVRASGIVQAWAKGDFSNGNPCVILGDLKSKMARRHPFTIFYEEFGRRLLRCGLAVVGGYSFGDQPVNDALRFYLARRDQPRLVVWVRRADAAKRAEILGRIKPEKTPDGRPVRFDDKQLVLVEASLPDATAVKGIAERTDFSPVG